MVSLRVGKVIAYLAHNNVILQVQVVMFYIWLANGVSSSFCAWFSGSVMLQEEKGAPVRTKTILMKKCCFKQRPDAGAQETVHCKLRILFNILGVCL